MNYSEYLFSCLWKLYDKEFEELEYDLQWVKIKHYYRKFEESKYNTKYKSLYDCIINYLEDKYGKRV